jgi:hypothetical protein
MHFGAIARMLVLASAKDASVLKKRELARSVTVFAKPKMFNLGYTTSLPDDSHHSPTTKVVQFPMAVRVGALRNHIDCC